MIVDKTEVDETVVDETGVDELGINPLQEIESIMGGGRIFDTGPFFTRLQYTLLLYVSLLQHQLLKKPLLPQQQPSLPRL